MEKGREEMKAMKEGKRKSKETRKRVGEQGRKEREMGEGM